MLLLKDHYSTFQSPSVGFKYASFKPKILTLLFWVLYSSAGVAQNLTSLPFKHMAVRISELDFTGRQVWSNPSTEQTTTKKVKLWFLA